MQIPITVLVQKTKHQYYLQKCFQIHIQPNPSQGVTRRCPVSSHIYLAHTLWNKQLRISLPLQPTTPSTVKEAVRFTYSLLLWEVRNHSDSIFDNHAVWPYICSKGIISAPGVFFHVESSLHTLFNISSDGPNVRKTIKGIFDTGADGLVDIGFCNIYVIHNAFKAGDTKFGIRDLYFTMDISCWFHMYPTREEDYKAIQNSLVVE